MKTLKPGRTEKQVTAEVLDAIRCFGLEPKRRNVGGMTNASGRYVRFGEPGEADWYVELPDGRTIFIEVKRENFSPARCRGKERERFARQHAEIVRQNQRGNVAFWTDNGGLVAAVLKAVLDGGRVEETTNGALHIIPRKANPDAERTDG